MSDGGIGGGVNFYGTFEISGTIDKACLKDVLKHINDILEGRVQLEKCKGQQVNGRMLSTTRALLKTNKKALTPGVKITFE
jgi:hypothetical protein